MDGLVNAIAKDAADVKPNENVAAGEAADVVPFQFTGDRMEEMELPPIAYADIESELKDIYDAQDVPYVANSDLITDIGDRAAEEIDLLARLSNPASQYSPDWYEESEETTPLAAVSARDELIGNYRDHLLDEYAVSENIADDIVQIIVGILNNYETPIEAYYEEHAKPVVP